MKESCVRGKAKSQGGHIYMIVVGYWMQNPTNFSRILEEKRHINTVYPK